MKTTIQILSALVLSFGIYSCGGDDASGDDAADSGSETNSEVNQDADNENVGDESNNDSASNKKEDQSYHISLDSDDGEMGTGMTTGKILISDNMICTVGDWKMRILTDEFRPNNMVGNIYNAQIISDDYNSNDCTCQMMNVEATGEKASVGEYVKMEGEVTCDEGTVAGTFVVQMIDQEK